jgi:DNA replication protein DnaC
LKLVAKPEYGKATPCEKCGTPTLCRYCLDCENSLRAAAMFAGPDRAVMVEMGIPERYHSAEPSATDTLPDRDGYFLHGPVGSGKTYEACGLLRAWSRQNHRRGLFVSLPDMLRRLRDEMHAETRPDYDTLPEEATGLLVLDDLSTAKMTDWASECLYMLVNTRYNAMRPTVYTSNTSLSAIAATHGDQIASRIAGSCRVVEIAQKDRRLES